MNRTVIPRLTELLSVVGISNRNQRSHADPAPMGGISGDVPLGPPKAVTAP